MPTLNFCGWKSDSQLTVRGQKIDKKEKLASTFKSHRSHIGGGECCVWEFLTILDLSHKFFFRLVTFNLILDKIPKKPLFYSRRINLHFVNNKAIVFRIDIDKLPKILQNHYVVVETNELYLEPSSRKETWRLRRAYEWHSITASSFIQMQNF